MESLKVEINPNAMDLVYRISTSLTIDLLNIKLAGKGGGRVAESVMDYYENRSIELMEIRKDFYG